MLITVFTPTYNRAHLLSRVYESLCEQTFKDFEWVIVDDGSVDDTRSLVDKLTIDNGQLTMRYFYQENGGKHRAINRGVKEAIGELFFIVDSDDYLPHDALETVVNEWKTVKNINHVGGVAGLDRYDHGGIVGSGLPKESINCNAIAIRLKHHVTGDLKEVFRTDVLRKYPFPEISGERFCPEQLVWFRIAQKYDLHYFNKPIYIAEYQEEGITANITRARMDSPIASMMTYAELTGYDIPFISKVKAAVNYWRFRLCLYKPNGSRLRANDHGKANANEFINYQLSIINCSGDDLPKLRWWWNWVAPLGYLMHLRDVRLC